ncbi:TetR/AcrR family transcriptional regulator [Devosia sp. 2618]|uniref:TetR/AcrR family transcriptional regulator n=1 Tax=Devosia sp. 2618 TaxID=3156454 RepID=UPI003396AE9C
MVRAGLTVDRLVEAGANLADEAGFDAVTPSALAKIFDVQVASLYSHVKNAHELKTLIALFALNQLADQAAEAVAGRSGKDALIALANVHRDFARTHPGLFAATRFPLDGPTAAKSGGVRLAQMMRAVLRGYALSDADQTHAVRLLGSVFLGFTMLELGGGFSHSAPDSEHSWLRTLDAMDAVLRSWPQTT